MHLQPCQTPHPTEMPVSCKDGLRTRQYRAAYLHACVGEKPSHSPTSRCMNPYTLRLILVTARQALVTSPVPLSLIRLVPLWRKLGVRRLVNLVCHSLRDRRPFRNSRWLCSSLRQKYQQLSLKRPTRSLTPHDSIIRNFAINKQLGREPRYKVYRVQETEIKPEL